MLLYYIFYWPLKNVSLLKPVPYFPNIQLWVHFWESWNPLPTPLTNKWKATIFGYQTRAVNRKSPAPQLYYFFFSNVLRKETQFYKYKTLLHNIHFIHKHYCLECGFVLAIQTHCKGKPQASKQTVLIRLVFNLFTSD